MVTEETEGQDTKEVQQFRSALHNEVRAVMEIKVEEAEPAMLRAADKLDTSTMWAVLGASIEESFREVLMEYNQERTKKMRLRGRGKCKVQKSKVQTGPRLPPIVAHKESRRSQSIAHAATRQQRRCWRQK